MSQKRENVSGVWVRNESLGKNARDPGNGGKRVGCGERDLPSRRSTFTNQLPLLEKVVIDRRRSVHYSKAFSKSFPESSVRDNRLRQTSHRSGEAIVSIIKPAGLYPMGSLLSLALLFHRGTKSIREKKKYP